MVVVGYWWYWWRSGGGNSHCRGVSCNSCRSAIVKCMLCGEGRGGGVGGGGGPDNSNHNHYLTPPPLPTPKIPSSTIQINKLCLITTATLKQPSPRSQPPLSYTHHQYPTITTPTTATPPIPLPQQQSIHLTKAILQQKHIPPYKNRNHYHRNNYSKIPYHHLPSSFLGHRAIPKAGDLACQGLGHLGVQSIQTNELRSYGSKRVRKTSPECPKLDAELPRNNLCLPGVAESLLVSLREYIYQLFDVRSQASVHNR